MIPHYDIIVIGTGGVGSAALYHLAKRGVRAIGLDRFPPGHDRGSSHGQTRIIRMAYHEHPNYVPLLQRAYQLWEELEFESGRKLFFQAGILFAGPAQGELVSGVLQSAAKYQLPVQQMSAAEASKRWPGYRLPREFSVVFEQRAGYLMVEECVTTHAELAVRNGAELRSGVAVRNWKCNQRTVVVETDQEVLSADRVVVTAGAWSGDLLAGLKIPLQVLRKPLFWYRSSDPVYRSSAGCPCFFFETLGGLFYGFPQSNDLGVKLAEHTGGEVVGDPLHVDRSLHAADQQRVEACLAEHLPHVARECAAHSVCMYTMSPDSHFIVGHHPQLPQLIFAAGLSGHGFKFTSVLGEIMAQLAVDGESPHEIEFLRPERFV